MDKDTQKGQFALGNITTSNYDAVVDTVEGSIIGGQIISVTYKRKKLAGAPQHNHFLFHSEAPEENGSRRKVTGDRYTVAYKAATGKINTFYPPGGIAFSHTHVLSKAPLLDSPGLVLVHMIFTTGLVVIQDLELSLVMTQTITLHLVV